jgi:hypothetical protein
MMVALTLALFASTSVGSPAGPTAAMRSDDPPIQVWLSSDNSFVRGERARVYIRAAQDGYVVVLRADAEGRVRVLFPLDPSADAFARGDGKFEVRGRGDRQAFTADDGDGTGVVLAAWSATPFTFDGLVRGDHWDYSALGAQQSGADKEAALVAVVQGMAGENHFDYDVATYTVNSVSAYNNGYYYGPYDRPWFGPGYGGWGLTLGFGHRWRYGYAGFGPFCDGFYWSTWGCGPFYDPFFPPLVYRPFGTVRFGGFYRQPFIGRTWGSYGFRNGGPWTSAQPRLRVPLASSALATGSRGFVRERTGTRVSAPVTRSFRNGGFARPSFAPRGQRVGGSAPAARSAPSGGSGRGGWSSAAPRSSGGSSRGAGGGGGGGGGGGRRGGGGGGGSGGGGGGRRR